MKLFLGWGNPSVKDFSFYNKLEATATIDAEEDVNCGGGVTVVVVGGVSCE